MKIVIVFLLLIFVGCRMSKDDSIEYCSVQYQSLNDELITTMPGSLILLDKYLVWTDPFGRNFIVHVHDRATGKEIGMMGKVGEGPNEFISGGINRNCIANRFYASDINSLTEGFLSIDSLAVGKESFISLQWKDSCSFYADQYDNDIFIHETDNGETYYFSSIINGQKSSFGVYPVPEVKEHLGTYDAYDSDSGYYVFASFTIPYIALYKKENNRFLLQSEREVNKRFYRIERDKLVVDPKISGVRDICMSKDYIVSLERDRKRDPIDESTVGRDVSKCPRTVFLYDYQLNLIKIVDLGIPVIRIAANRKSNTFYFIGADPDYVLGKYEL